MQTSDNTSSERELMLSPDSPAPSEPYDPRDPSCAASASGLPPAAGYVKPTLEEGEVDGSRLELSADDKRYAREVAAKLVKELYWPARVRVWKESAEPLRAERLSSSIGAIAVCRVGLSIDEVIALHPASLMDLAEGGEATEEGVLEPEPLRQTRGSVVRGTLPHYLAEVLQFNWLTQVDWAAGGTKEVAMEHGTRVRIAWVRLLSIREVEKRARGHGEFPSEPDDQQGWRTCRTMRTGTWDACGISVLV
eukprot:661463-Pleurochrysis_carterae.AAC.8